MRGLSLAFAAALVTMAPAIAAEPVGEWLVKDKVATIRIENCGGNMWGFVAWEKMPGGTDENNPDASKRSRPVLGLPIILGMKQTGANKWEGRIYNTQDGRIYPANISLADPNTLRVEGCLFGFLCGGENWTRVRGDAVGRTAARTMPARELCARVADATPSRRR